MTAETVTNAVARKDSSPRAMIRQYSTDFATVLPAHINSATWVRLAEGALKKGKRIDDKQDANFGQFELEVAARNNPGVFLAALLDAARLGLEPGSEQYYLTPRKVKGQLEILGIVGYQGYIELMYRAGAISSIVADVVRENDIYQYRRGIDEVPLHEYPSFAAESDRGALKGVYAYARMKDGAVSRVVELGRDDIARIKKSSQGSDSPYSPWKNFEAAMWLKSSIRQLQKWVPTSAHIREQIAQASARAQHVADSIPGAPAIATGVEEDFIDGTIVVEGDWPTAATPGGGQ